jgi:hypothetical protein
MTTPDTIQARRPLTDLECDTILAGITAADNTTTLLQHLLNSLYQALLAGAGTALADYDDTRRLDPRSLAIPTTQWQALVDAAVNRAHQWGTGNQLAMELINLMPSSYDDPTVPAPAIAAPVDYRPYVHELHIAREAVDVIAACHRRIEALGEHFGWQSTFLQEAARSWLHLSAGLFAMNLGAHTRITRDGALSLHVATGGGLVYGIIFHPTPRTCVLPGCGTTIADDHSPDNSPVNHDGPHIPSYPIDAPQPGRWSFHS